MNIRITRVERQTIVLNEKTGATKVQERKHLLFKGSQKALDIWKPMHALRATDIWEKLAMVRDEKLQKDVLVVSSM